MKIRDREHDEFESGRRVARFAADRPAEDTMSILSVPTANRRASSATVLSSNTVLSSVPSTQPSELEGSSYTVVAPVQEGLGNLTLSERPMSLSSTSGLRSELEATSVLSSELDGTSVLSTPLGGTSVLSAELDTSVSTFGRFELEAS